MTRREWLVLTASTAVPASAAQRPNIVLIISDDHHFQCIGAAGNPNVRTPNIDRLASRGLHFSNALISCAQCAPSRGILLSGREPYQTGLDCNNHIAWRTSPGPTVVEQIRQSGYDTVLVGKWHITPTPRECGFAKAPLWKQPAAGQYRNPQLRRGLDGKDERVEGHITDLLSDTAAAHIKSAATDRTPYLLWLAYTAPHTPWDEDAKYKAAYKGKGDSLAAPIHPKGGAKFDWETYYSVIEHLDEGVGRVLAAIDAAGQWDNTLIVFMGDNGYLCGTKNFQGKVEAWEESIRVPMIMSGGAVRGRGKLDAPVASVDLPATFADYAAVKPSYKLSGRSLRAELETGKSRRTVAFSSWNDGRPEALMVPRAVEPYRVARSRTHKLIVWESKKRMLFDIVGDPGETRDLSGDILHAKPLGKLLGALRSRMRETGDPAILWLS